MRLERATRLRWKLELFWLHLRNPLAFKEARFRKCKKLMDALVADGILVGERNELKT
jgi:hypothetical protein